MSQMKCDLCRQLFVDDDRVKAVVIGRYASLKSQRTYALKAPLEDCLTLIHFNCQYPQGNVDDD